KNIVFCGDKRIINADYLIDDEARHFAKFRGNGILFSAPHNSKDVKYERVGSWQEIRTKFLGCAATRYPELQDVTAKIFSSTDDFRPFRRLYLIERHECFRPAIGRK